MALYAEHCHQTLCSVEGWEFLRHLSSYHIFKHHCAVKLISTKVYLTIPSDDAVCLFMVMTLTVWDMFIGNAGRRRIVQVFRAVCVALRSRLHTFRTA